MIISNQPIMNSNSTPNIKRTRFSEHPQVFEYSSKSKKEDPDNDSMLLDMDDPQSDTNQNNSLNKVRDRTPYKKSDPLFQSNLNIEQMTSHLDFIEDFLKDNSEPIRETVVPAIEQQAKKYSSPSEKQRFSVKIGPQLKSGRETLTLEQQERVVNSIKHIPDEISNNKKRMMMEKLERQPIDQQIEKQLKKKQRITMDVRDLMSMLSSYEKGEQTRKSIINRITMDRFALGKMLEQAAKDDVLEEPDNEDMVTPVRKRKSMIFSAFKQNASDAEIELQIEKYIEECVKRSQNTKNQNQKIMSMIVELKQELHKNKLKVAEAEKHCEQSNKELFQINEKIKQKKKEIERTPFQKCKSTMRRIQEQLGFQIIKYQNDRNWNFYGHFQFQGIFSKIKSRGRDQAPEIKLMSSSQRQKNQGFIFSREDSLRILKKYLRAKVLPCQNLLLIALQVKNSVDRIKELDLNLQYISLSVELVDFQLGSNLDRLKFKMFMGKKVELLVEISLPNYLENPQEPKNIMVYDSAQHEYLAFDVKGEQILFQIMAKMIELYIR